MLSADGAEIQRPVVTGDPVSRRAAPPVTTGRRFSAAVVLAGGESRRFGADKLAHPIDGRPLLDHTLAGLATDWQVYLVGPPRRTDREVVAVREDPPGGGPTAGLIAGLRAALADGAEIVLVVPGDAPLAGAAARLMLERLHALPEADALIGCRSRRPGTTPTARTATSRRRAADRSGRPGGGVRCVGPSAGPAARSAAGRAVRRVRLRHRRPGSTRPLAHSTRILRPLSVSPSPRTESDVC